MRRLPASWPPHRNPHSRLGGAWPWWVPPERAWSRRLRGLAGADERSHHPASHLPCQHLRVQAGPREERFGVLELIDAGGLDADLLEPGLPQQRGELLLGEGTSYPPDPQLHA